MTTHVLVLLNLRNSLINFLAAVRSIFHTEILEAKETESCLSFCSWSRISATDNTHFFMDLGGIDIHLVIHCKIWPIFEKKKKKITNLSKLFKFNLEEVILTIWADPLMLNIGFQTVNFNLTQFKEIYQLNMYIYYHFTFVILTIYMVYEHIHRITFFIQIH